MSAIVKQNAVEQRELIGALASYVSDIKLSGKELARREGKGPKGSPQNPLSDAEMHDKFRRLVQFKLSSAALDDYIARAAEFDAANDWSWLVKAFD